MSIGRRIQTLVAYVGGALATALVVVASPVTALPIETTVGSGPNTAHILFEFQDSTAYVFDVLFSGLSISGIAAINTIDAALASFDADLLDFGPFGFAVDGITYGASSNIGYGGGELWWHYFTKEAENDAWVFSNLGASFRQIENGGWDGWKYEAGAPIPEPGTAVLVSLGLVVLGYRRRHARSRGLA